MKKLSWPDFKQIIDSKNLEFQSKTDPEGYQLSAYDGPLFYSCDIDQTDTDGPAHKTEYENNYAHLANRRISGVVFTKEAPAFASKKDVSGKRFFQRVHGLEMALDSSGADQVFIFSIPYLSCKMSGVSILNAVIEDRLDFKVLDTPVGTVSGTPNAVLNQFGFDVYPSEKFFKHDSPYDADMFQGLQIQITIKPSDSVSRSLYANIILHELK